jgi:RNA polymerase sigma-70 factor (ECF subfamily)
VTDSEANAHLDRARSGDREALVQLLRLHADAIRTEIRARLPQRWKPLLDAEDILQQTCLDAFLAFARFSPFGEDAFLRWLRRLAQNNLVQAVRALETEKRGGRARRVDPLPLGDACTSLFERLVSAGTQTSPSQNISRAEAKELIRAAIAALPEPYRLAVQRYDLEGRTIDEVASELGRSPGAVHLLRLRAHARLRGALAEKMTVLRELA